MRVLVVALVSVVFWFASHPTGGYGSDTGGALNKRYAGMLNQLRTELSGKLTPNKQANGDALDQFLASDALDARFTKYVILLKATPRGLAEFARQGKEQANLTEKLLADTPLVKQMLVADGASAKREGRG